MSSLASYAIPTTVVAATRGRPPQPHLSASQSLSASESRTLTIINQCIHLEQFSILNLENKLDIV